MSTFTTMTTEGQLTIPKDVRDSLNLSPGTRFYATARNEQVVAVPGNWKSADLAGFLGAPPSRGLLSVGEMNDAVMDAVAEDDRRITQEGSGTAK